MGTKMITANRIRALTLGLMMLMTILLVVFAAAKPAQATFPGQNGKLAIASDGDIWTMNSDGSSSVNLTNSVSRESEPTYSPDGRKVAYHLSVGLAGIYVMNANGSDPRLIKACSTCYDPTWAPDGKRIAYSENDWIYTMRTDGTDVRKLTPGRVPLYSPDGTKISFARQASSGYWWVYYVPVVGGQAVQITPSSHSSSAGSFTYFGTGQGSHSWAPDSSNIVYETNESRNDFYTPDTGYEIFRISLSGGKPVRVTNHDSIEYTVGSPVYSPDGTNIALQRGYSNFSAIYIYARDGSTSREVSSARADGSNGFDWQPTGVPALDIKLPPPPDTIRPTVSYMSLKHRSITRDTTPPIAATVKDNMTNMQKSNIKLYVAGKRITTFNYSAATDRLTYTSPRLTKGKKVVKIVATDAAGNVGAKSWYFTIR